MGSISGMGPAHTIPWGLICCQLYDLSGGYRRMAHHVMMLDMEEIRSLLEPRDLPVQMFTPLIQLGITTISIRTPTPSRPMRSPQRNAPSVQGFKGSRGGTYVE